ncbi:uncharacterized protein METZ01_LOCUS320244, partial [marine metagenome]
FSLPDGIKFYTGTNDYRLQIDAEGTQDHKGNATVNSSTVQGLQDGAGYDFDGADDYIDLGANTTFSTGAYTISAWIKSNDTTHTYIQNIVGYATNNVGYFCVHTSGKLAYWDYGGGAWRYGNTVLTSGKWHHVVMVYDGDDGGFFYLDGVADSAELAYSGTTAQKNCVLRYIGANQVASSASNDRHFLGQMRDVKIMPSALSAGEIRKLYSGENPKKNLYFEMVTDGTFTNTANWVEGTGWSIGAAGATHTGSSSYITQTPIVNYVEGQWYVATCDCTLTSGGLYLVNHTTPSPVDVQFTISGSRAYAVWYQSSVNLSSTNVYATGNVTITNLKISKVGTLLDFIYRSASSTKWYNQAIP